MRTRFLIIFLIGSLCTHAQEEGDTVLNRCPVYITDTVSSNNFFLEVQPATVKVYRQNGNLTIQVAQKDQFFTLFFRERKLRNTKYKIVTTDRSKRDINAKYSFRSGTGTAASFVDVSSGNVETAWDKEKQLWRLKVNGMLTTLNDRSVTYYKVKADFFIK
jgi:hypothetical protein